MNYLLGYDLGSSFLKGALVEAESGKIVAKSKYPSSEMSISAPHSNWAEQNPEDWWNYLISSTRELLQESGINKDKIKGIGISYQMHGLVLVDKNQKSLRPSIIWCDSRANEIGEDAYHSIGPEICLNSLLNSPGNFTGAKLKWVEENEPEIFDRTFKIMLPGDFIAMKLTGEISSTVCGMSEGILWDFKNHSISKELTSFWDFSQDLFPDLVPVFGNQGVLTEEAAHLLGLQKGIPVSYRAGDQPNNAMSLNVLKPGEFAANGGTSGVIYGVTDQLIYDSESRVNSFAHVNHSVDKPRIGILLCINGTGIQYRWIKEQVANNGIGSYDKMESILNKVPINSGGLRILPFGNGAERMFHNKVIGSHILNLQLNTHTRTHMYRASLEGIAFAFAFGMEILNNLGLDISQLAVGNDNLFQSNVFATTVCQLIQAPIKILEMNGAAGAARAAGIGLGYYSIDEAFSRQTIIRKYEPENHGEIYREGYEAWKKDLNKFLNNE